MDARRIILVVLSCMLLNVTVYHGVPSTSELVIVPHAVLPKKGVVEYGIEEKVYEFDNKIKYSELVVFFKSGFADTFHYNLEVTDTFDTLHSLSAQVMDITSDGYRHRLAFGFKNLGWDKTKGVRTSLPVIHSYGVYTFTIPKRRAHYHVGIADYKNTGYDVLMFGVHYDFTRVTTMAEWDGRQVHFGARFNVSDQLRFYTSVSPSPFQGFGPYYHYASFALSYKLNIYKDLLLEKEKVMEMEQRYEDIATRMKVLDAKTDVIREFSSLDFLEEFEAFLLKQHLVEKELEEESKTMIKSALEHMQRGLEYYYAGQYELALKEYKLVVSLLPNFSIGYTRLGSIYYKLGDVKQAKFYWEKALKMDPNNNGLKAFLKRVTPLPQSDEEELPPLEELNDVQADNTI